MFSDFDTSLTELIQSWQPGWLTIKMKIVTSVFSPEVLIVTSVGLIMWLWWRRQKTSAALIFIMTAGNIFTPVLKHIFNRPRPSADQVHVLIQETGFSLPSGHALAIVLFAVAVWIFVKNMSTLKRSTWLLWVLCILVFSVGYSRIYLGVHWPTDVLAGYGIGALWALASLRFGSNFRPRIFPPQPTAKGQ